MSTQTPDPTQQPAPPQPPATEAGQPRDDSGRFAAPQPPTMKPPTGPAPPTVAAPEPDNQQAIDFYNAFRDPQRQAQQFLTTGQQYGLIPSDLTADDVFSVLRDAAAYKRQMQQPQAPQQPPQGPQGAPMPQQGPPPPDGGYDPAYDAYGYMPQAPDPAVVQLVQEVQALKEAQQQREQRDTERDQQMVREQAIASINRAVDGVFEGQEVTPAQRQLLAQNVAQGIDQALGAGMQINFTDAAGMRTYASQVLDQLATFGAARVQANQQEQLLRHRGIAPQTVTPAGNAQAGQPTGPRGMAGVAARVKAQMAAQGM